MDFLKSAVASAIAKGPLAAYNIGDRVDLEESIWSLNHATKREDGSRCSVFTFDIGARRKQLPLARNALRKCRTLRHPGVIKILETAETESQLCIVTERLIPLAHHVRTNSLTEESIKWGLWSIAKTVAFINNEAASVHACLRLSSVFTGESGEWKLGGFEVLSAISDDDAMIHAHTGLVPGYGRLMPPEVVKAGWGIYRQNPWPAVDAYGYANLISDVFHGSASGPSQPSDLKGFPPSMSQNYKRLVNPNPKGRLMVAAFLEQGRRSGGYFQTRLTSLSDSLDNLGLKSEGEREEFVNELNEVAHQFPEEFLKNRILPELLKSIEFGGGGPNMLTVVLQIGAKLSEEDYSGQVTPVIVRLFGNPDRALRISLLDSLPIMIDRLPKATVNDKIFPCLITGFSDLAPLVREQTVKSVLIIIPKLSDRTINGELLKHLAKTSNDSEAGIRTNTTICLGKIAKYLGTNTRTKVLVAAFTRSLRDPFIHARSAAILALGATLDMFSEEDCAAKILPALCPSLLDKEKIIRDQAHKCLDQYIARVRKHAQNMPDTALSPTSTNGSVKADAPHMGTPSGDNSWTGWAISSFTNRLATANGDIQPSPRATVAEPSSINKSTIVIAKSKADSGAGLGGVSVNRPNLSRQATESTKLAQSFTYPELAAAADDDWGNTDDGFNSDGDAWGEMDDDKDAADEGDQAQAVSPQIPATGRSSIPLTRTTRSTKAVDFDDQGEPDFAGWLKAKKSSNAAKASLPKGLGPSSRPDSATAKVKNSRSAPAPKMSNTKPAKTVSDAPEKEAQEDDWGDAWT